MLYFSYGSNMSLQRMKERVPGAELFSIATLFGHQLKFHKLSKDLSGKCDAYCTNRKDDFVIGVVYRIGPNEKRELDQIEVSGFGYVNKTVELQGCQGQAIVAFTYCATKIDQNLKPYHWYKEHVLRGAEAAKLPNEYIESIRNIESLEDPDQSKAQKELSIYS